MGYPRISQGVLLPVARGLAMSLALFTLVNVSGSHWVSGFDANVWWIDLRILPRPLGTTVLTLAAIGLLCFSAGRFTSPQVRRGSALTTAVLLIATLWNATTFYREWLAGRVRPGVPVPLSLLLGAALLFILWQMVKAPVPTGARRWRAGLAALGAATVVFPVAQMYCFGKTDYSRPADAIVVFGARAYADGTPSMVLADRTRTAVMLYRRGLAPSLIFSGGPGDGAISEPRAMRAMALSMGVPASAITLDEGGRNTSLTVQNTVPVFAQRRYARVLAVSHFYHLPRVKLAYERALSAAHSPVEVLTVPAENAEPLPQMPWYEAREVAALWAYYLRPLFRAG